MSDENDVIGRLAEDLGATVKEVGVLPDGSGFATMSMPLPKDHWLFAEGPNVPPMPFRCGEGLLRGELAGHVRAAARYATRCATMNGKDMDFDPDALVQNFVVGMLGYWTPDGLSGDADQNPVPVPPEFGRPPHTEGGER